MQHHEAAVTYNEFEGRVSVSEPFLRYPGNPILTSQAVNAAWDDPRLRAYTVHNAGVAEIAADNGRTEVVMLFRSHIADGRSVIGKAVSANGLTGWQVDPRPFLLPATQHDTFADTANPAVIIAAEGGGVEDVRINPAGDGSYVLTYSAYHQTNMDEVRVLMATTRDFKHVVRHGAVSHTDMRNMVLFPEPDAGGRWHALVRPNDKHQETGGAHTGGSFNTIRLAHAPAPTGPWTLGEAVMQTGFGPGPFQHKIGPGAPPLATSHGLLHIFHGVRSTMDGNVYSLGVAFHNPADLRRVRLSARPLTMPEPRDCRLGDEGYVHVPHVVFACGALLRTDGTVVVYYGGNDTVMNVGLTHVDVLNAMCTQFSQDPLTGRHRYSLSS